jgi:hypothetical protein
VSPMRAVGNPRVFNGPEGDVLRDCVGTCSLETSADTIGFSRRSREPVVSVIRYTAAETFTPSLCRCHERGVLYRVLISLTDTCKRVLACYVSPLSPIYGINAKELTVSAFCRSWTPKLSPQTLPDRDRSRPVSHAFNTSQLLNSESVVTKPVNQTRQLILLIPHHQLLAVTQRHQASAKTRN